MFPSGNGISNAAALARLFAPLALGGELDGYRLLSPATLARACEEQWHYPDPIFGDDFRCSMGLLLHSPFSYFGRDGNVGSAGAGGYTACATIFELTSSPRLHVAASPPCESEYEVLGF